MLPFDISTSQLLLASLATILLYWLWRTTERSYTKYNIPPFPCKPWPIVGHVAYFFGNFRKRLKEWPKKCGSIYSLDIGGQLHILVNDFNDLKEIFLKNADYIVNLPQNFSDEILKEVNTGIAGARDDNWKEQRTISRSILRYFGMGKNIMAKRVQEEVSILVDRFAELKGRPEDVKLLLHLTAANVISAVTVGKRFDHDDPHFIRLNDHVKTIVKYFTASMVLTAFRKLYYLPGNFFYIKEYINAAKGINEEYSIPSIHKLKHEFKEKEEPDNFITAYLNEIKKAKDKGENSNLNERNLIVLVRTFFFAGTDTTSTTILWCLLYMLHYPDVQEKVYREIEANVGLTRQPNMADKPNLPYLNAFIFETQRISSLVPCGFLREVSETFEYGGFTFPKGSTLCPIFYPLNHDKRIWEDPKSFRPERFINQNGELINREELIAFGIGKRSCLGEALARMEVFLCLSALFQRFRFEPADLSGELPSLKGVLGSVIVPCPFKLRCIDRRV